VGDGTQQVSNKQVQDRLAMPYPDAEGLGFGAKACLGFEGGAAERNALAAEFQGVGNDGMQQSQVDRNARTAFAVETDEVTDCRIVVLHGRHEPKQSSFPFHHTASESVACDGGERGQIAGRNGD